jgi:hypothetical protein
MDGDPLSIRKADQRMNPVVEFWRWKLLENYLSHTTGARCNRF